MGTGPAARLQGKHMKAAQSLPSTNPQSLKQHFVWKCLLTKKASTVGMDGQGHRETLIGKRGTSEPEKLSRGSPFLLHQAIPYLPRA